MGTICVETFVEPDFYVCNDDCTTLEPPGYSEKPDEVASEITTTSYVKRIHLYKVNARTYTILYRFCLVSHVYASFSIETILDADFQCSPTFL